eukprot:3941540-Rhodomonas_salina.1
MGAYSQSHTHGSRPGTQMVLVLALPPQGITSYGLYAQRPSAFKFRWARLRVSDNLKFHCRRSTRSRPPRRRPRAAT